jgi:hypothetical protein
VHHFVPHRIPGNAIAAASLPQVAENATICRRHGYDRVPAAAALSICLRMIFSENRVPLFGIML